MSESVSEGVSERVTVTVTVFRYCDLLSKGRYWCSYNKGLI